MHSVMERAAAFGEPLGGSHLGSAEVLVGMTGGLTRISRTLSEHGVDEATVRSLATPRTPGPRQELLGLTPSLERTFQRAARLRDLGRGGAVEPEHVLLAMLGERESIAAHMLRQLCVDEQALRLSLMKNLR